MTDRLQHPVRLGVVAVFFDENNCVYKIACGVGYDNSRVHCYGYIINVPNLYRLEGMGMEEGITASEVMVFGTGV